MAETLTQEFRAVDTAIDELERELRERGALPLAETLEQGMELVRRLLRAYAGSEGKPIPQDPDLLVLLKAFVKGDPSLNAVRDNVRELVYYRNCLDMNRADALPVNPDRMVVRTARHIYLYLRSRLEQAGRLEA